MGGGGLKMFFDSFPQGSARFPNVGTGAVDVWALVLVDDSCLVNFGVLVLGVAQGCSEGVGALKVDLDTSAFAQSFELFCCFWDVGDHYGSFVVVVVGWVAAGAVVGVCSWCLLGMVEFVFPQVEGPGGELAAVEGCFNVVKFLVHVFLG